jgi:hypothetical protein
LVRNEFYDQALLDRGLDTTDKGYLHVLIVVPYFFFYFFSTELSAQMTKDIFT